MSGVRLDRAWLLDSLGGWADFAERWWQPDPSDPAAGWFGTGYNDWGVQTNQKYAGAMAVLGALGPPGARRDRAAARARAALRFTLDSHVSGSGRCSDGTQWGHTWISPLGIERMMHGVALIEPTLDDSTVAAIERMLISEADSLLQTDIVGDRWAASRRNVPESNLWKGALLWRTAARYPDHERAERWREHAVTLLVNSVSIAADADDPAIVDGAPVSDRFRGANFFPHFALDHHGYLNVGYQVICVSNAAMLHFDLRAAGSPAPESLHRHQADLWAVIRRQIFQNGRLARIGGDSRVRYAYCQDYLLPALLYAADRHGDGGALGLAERQLALIEHEARDSDDGGYYSRRLAHLARENPYYFTRLESDRACVIGMAAAYLPLVRRPGGVSQSVHGGWCEPEHGAVLQRGPRRIASFAWGAHGLAQGLNQPPDDGHLAEWQENFGGRVRLLGDGGTVTTSRRLLAHHIETFSGGFTTSGSIIEGAALQIPEGWSGTDGALSQLAIAALPDDRTMIGLHYCRALKFRVFPLEALGLCLNVPNDLYNGRRRTLTTARGVLALSPPATSVITSLGCSWVNVDDRVGAIGLYGGDSLRLDRSSFRRAGPQGSLFVERIHYGDAPESVAAGGTILDIGWVSLAGVDADQTREFAREQADPVAHTGAVRAVRVRGADGREYLFQANFTDSPQTVPAAGRDLTGAATGPLSAGRCRLIVLD
ncbi:MAG TPA: hypothetical protein VHC49_24975 [Mycobacteriales bacterium]|nr:hypothetical protein [Mycobacteriales bacterium]